MLKAIGLENFKAFGSATKIDLAPITLIFGQNSAGKSSILQALSLLKQTKESRESGAQLLPRAEGGIADLGSFQELLFNHDLSRTLTIALQVDTARGRHPRALSDRWFGPHRPDSVGLGMQFTRPDAKSEVELSGFDVELGPTNGPIASFKARSLATNERGHIGRYYWGPVRRRERGQVQTFRAAECTFLSQEPALWEPYHAEWDKARPNIHAALAQISKEHTPQRALLGDLEDVGDSRFEQEAWHEALKEALQFYSKGFDLQSFVDRMQGAVGTAVVGLDGFVPLQLGPLGQFGLPEFAALDYRRTRERELPSVPDVSAMAAYSGRLVEESLHSLFPMGPYRRPPERWYIFTGTSPADVGYRGDLLPDLLFRREDLVEKANSWLERLEIGYSLRVRPIGGGNTSDLFEVRLVDRVLAGEVNVALSDVGFGISQILPFHRAKSFFTGTDHLYRAT